MHMQIEKRSLRPTSLNRYHWSSGVGMGRGRGTFLGALGDGTRSRCSLWHLPAQILFKQGTLDFGEIQCVWHCSISFHVSREQLPFPKRPWPTQFSASGENSLK